MQTQQALNIRSAFRNRMKIKYDLYIAGAMHGRPVNLVQQERAIATYFCRLSGLSYYDPAADEGLHLLAPHDTIDLVPNVRLMKHYVRKDDANLDKCRYLLVLTGDLSTSGTSWEMARHHYRNHRPIVLVSPKRCAGDLVNFTNIKAPQFFVTIEDAVKWIAKDIKKKRGNV